MSVSQPPISDDPIISSWDYEVTSEINRLEQRLDTLLEAIREATDLNDLKQKVEDL